MRTLETFEKLARSYSEKIDFKPHNAFYDRPNTLGILPDPKGKQLLDAGCGPGKYAEILISKGAKVVGVDLSPKMIEEAIKRNGTKGEFKVSDLTQPLDFADEVFDIVLCPLVMDYIRHWNPTLKEFHRILKPNGNLVFSITHPFFDFIYFKSSNYFKTEKVSATWRGFGEPVEVESIRRPLMDCITPLVESGFILDKVLEPLPTKEFEQHDPRHYKELNEFPSFLCIKATKKCQ